MIGTGCDIFLALAFDHLHVLKSGVLGSHLVPLTMEAMEENCGVGALSTLDRRHVCELVTTEPSAMSDTGKRLRKGIKIRLDTRKSPTSPTEYPA